MIALSVFSRATISEISKPNRMMGVKDMALLFAITTIINSENSHLSLNNVILMIIFALYNIILWYNDFYAPDILFGGWHKTPMTCDIWKRSLSPSWLTSVFITLALVILELASPIFVLRWKPTSHPFCSLSPLFPGCVRLCFSGAFFRKRGIELSL